MAGARPEGALGLPSGGARSASRASGPSGLGRAIAIGLGGAVCGGLLAFFLKPPPVDETRFVNFDPESAPATILVGGWSSFEQFLPGGDTFVWCAASSCRLRVQSRAEADRLLRVRLMPFRYTGAPPQTITAYLNETQLGTKPVADGMTVISFRISRSFWMKGPNEIRFEFAYADDPKTKIPGSEDSRKLSAGFDWLEIAAP